MEAERLLDLIGVLIVLALIAGGALLLSAAMSTQPGQGQSAPDSNWTMERLNDTHVQLTLKSGEPVETDKLEVTVAGNPRTVDWSGTLFEGNEGTLRAKEGHSVTLYWKASLHADRLTLASWKNS
jgi:hypothetical protein